MKLSFLKDPMSIAGRWLTMALVCVSAIAFIWQGAPLSNDAAWAAVNPSLIASIDDAGNQVKDKVSKDSGRAKGFIRDTADKVERTAQKNAERVENATDDSDSFLEGKAKRDAARIQAKSEKDAARTQKAVDKTQNAVKGTVEKIKDAFN
jgi:vacuolar-type H+-ATPase subunit H